MRAQLSKNYNQILKLFYNFMNNYALNSILNMTFCYHISIAVSSSLPNVQKHS